MKIIISGILVYTIITIVLLTINNTKPRLNSYDAIIVLGNSPNYKNKPNQFLKNRLNTGIRYLKEGYSSKIILTGGKKDSQLSESKIMKRYCLNNGINPNQIITEELSKSTKENLINSIEVMFKANLKNALVITSTHHVNRTKKYCELLNIQNLEIVNCKNNLITGILYIPLSLREMLKINKIE